VREARYALAHMEPLLAVARYRHAGDNTKDTGARRPLYKKRKTFVTALRSLSAPLCDGDRVCRMHHRLTRPEDLARIPKAPQGTLAYSALAPVSPILAGAFLCEASQGALFCVPAPQTVFPCGGHGSGQAMVATLLCFRKSTLVFTAPQFAHSKLWTARSARIGCGLITPGFKGLRHFGQTSFIKRSKDRVSLL
jgi:hypothetical protein